jgi:hypothetical protein
LFVVNVINLNGVVEKGLDVSVTQEVSGPSTPLRSAQDDGCGFGNGNGGGSEPTLCDEAAKDGPPGKLMLLAV